jgi:hypothetical protein
MVSGVAVVSRGTSTSGAAVGPELQNPARCSYTGVQLEICPGTRFEQLPVCLHPRPDAPAQRAGLCTYWRRRHALRLLTTPEDGQHPTRGFPLLVVNLVASLARLISTRNRGPTANESSLAREQQQDHVWAFGYASLIVSPRGRGLEASSRG